MKEVVAMNRMEKLAVALSVTGVVCVAAAQPLDGQVVSGDGDPPLAMVAASDVGEVPSSPERHEIAVGSASGASVWLEGSWVDAQRSEVGALGSPSLGPASNLLPAHREADPWRVHRVTMAQQRNRAGIPWIIAGSALIVGGAIVGDDIGTLLMASGVVGVAYGVFIYF
jgi:hypothetical protein